MAKALKIDPDTLYKVEVQLKCEVAGLSLRPGMEAVLSGAAVIELGDKVTVTAKYEA